VLATDVPARRGLNTAPHQQENAMNTFDPIQYKATTREQWQSAAEAWHRWGPLLEHWLGAATQRMLDAAGVQTGSHVLDVAAGAGGQSLAAAQRTGRGGRVLATDISPAILDFARQAAARAGLGVDTRELDGEAIDALGSGTFDAVISRLGLIYFPDQQRALSGMRHVLRPGGRIGAIVYSTAERNAFFSIPVRIIRTRANLPPPAAGQPGPFSLGSPGTLQAALQKAGFHDVTVETLAAPVRLPSAAECVRFERESFGALHQMLSPVPEPERASVWREIEEALQQFETKDGFVGPCELLVVGATR
jgi:ubiquinone/menaquinone biosynthesis C-methylase UbiE